MYLLTITTPKKYFMCNNFYQPFNYRFKWTGLYKKFYDWDKNVYCIKGNQIDK